MKKTSPTINLDALQNPKPPKKKEEKRRIKLSRLFKKKEKDPNTRDLRFARRPIQKLVTIFIYSFIFLSFLVLTMTLGRLQTLTQIAYKKEVTKEQLAKQVNGDNEKTQQVVYEGNQFLQNFFSIKAEEEALVLRKETLSSYLAKDLALDRLESLSIETNRSVRDIQLITCSSLEEDKYKLTYDVVFEEKEQIYQAQILLTASFKENQWKLINIPMFLNIEMMDSEQKNEDSYNPSDFYTTGEEVEGSEKERLKDFVEKFFRLYVTDDENLKLISNVRGLKNATLNQLEIKNTKIVKGGLISIEGTYTIHYQEGSGFTSFFSLQLEKNQDSYFVKNLGSN